MFEPEIYRSRRRELIRTMEQGIVLLPGNSEASINYRGNKYPFVQDGSFNYFFGLQKADLVGFIDLDSGEEILFGDDPDSKAIIWHGVLPSLSELAQGAGIVKTLPLAELETRLLREKGLGRRIHFLPQHRADTVRRMESWLGLTARDIDAGTSLHLIRAVVALRETKGPEEILEMEDALTTTAQMHLAAMAASVPGVMEYEVVGEMEGILRRRGWHTAYSTIFTRRGEVLHNHDHGGRLDKGDIVVNDAGTASGLGYASDISRTLPIGGRFSERQKPIYEAVLASQSAGIEHAAPGVPFLEVHKQAMRTMVDALHGTGLFRGNTYDIVESGAYALAFPAGVGHQIGLDVHDMEGLGEDHVGYDSEIKRSLMFGYRSLRMAKALRPGMVLTVEPGIYFIPELISLWEAERTHEAFINYDVFRSYVGFGGLRVEDEILITDTGSRVLGPPIPKSISAVEGAMGR